MRLACSKKYGRPHAPRMLRERARDIRERESERARARERERERERGGGKGEGEALPARRTACLLAVGILTVVESVPLIYTEKTSRSCWPPSTEAAARGLRVIVSQHHVAGWMSCVAKLTPSHPKTPTLVLSLEAA